MYCFQLVFIIFFIDVVLLYITTNQAGSTRHDQCVCKHTLTLNTSNPIDLACFCEPGHAYNATSEECQLCGRNTYKVGLTTPGSADDKCLLCEDYCDCMNYGRTLFFKSENMIKSHIYFFNQRLAFFQSHI